MLDYQYNGNVILHNGIRIISIEITLEQLLTLDDMIKKIEKIVTDLYAISFIPYYTWDNNNL